MRLSTGFRLGPYQVLSPLGAGGMGEVYKARDSRLERTVAVKVLNGALTSSPELKQRFDREASTISQLQHAHICTLYDVGHDDGVDFLVMEYLEGETLADRLCKLSAPARSNSRDCYPDCRCAGPEMGRSLFYNIAVGPEETRIMVARYQTRGESFSASAPTLWASTPLVNRAATFNYDLHPDGKRIAVLTPSGGRKSEPLNKLNFIFNFPEELRRKGVAN